LERLKKNWCEKRRGGTELTVSRKVTERGIVLREEHRGLEESKRREGSRTRGPLQSRLAILTYNLG